MQQMEYGTLLTAHRWEMGAFSGQNLLINCCSHDNVVVHDIFNLPHSRLTWSSYESVLQQLAHRSVLLLAAWHIASTSLGQQSALTLPVLLQWWACTWH
jgi:hypothetical protein